MDLRVALHEPHVPDRLLVRAAPGHSEHGTGQVDPDRGSRRSNDPGGGEGGGPASAADVEDDITGGDSGSGEQRLGDGGQRFVSPVRILSPAASAVAVPGRVLVGVRDANHPRAPARLASTAFAGASSLALSRRPSV